MKYDHFSMLPEKAFQPRNGRSGMTLEGGGGGGGHTTSTVTQSSIPDWLRPQTEALLGAATQEIFNTRPNAQGGYDIVGTKGYTPYSSDPRDYVAGFTPQEQAVFYEAAGMQTPGEFGAASQYSQMAGMGGVDVGGQALGYGAQAAGMGGLYEQMATSPGAIAAYMSPYQQNVIDIAKRQAISDAQKGQLGANLAAARQGTYGGGRQAVLQAEREAGLQTNLADIQTKGLQDAYQQAQQAQQFATTTGLQGLQTGISGAQTGLQGYNLLGQMGGQLADIGTAGQAADISRMGFQQQMGSLPREQQQQIIDQAIQNFAMAEQAPQQNLAFYNALLRGYATPTTTTSQYQAAPSGLQQLSGLGMTAAGLGTVAGMGRKAGGVIKYAEGGITDVNALESMAEDLSIPQLQQSMQNETLPKYVGMPILENKVNEAERMKMAQSMMGGQQQGGQSISDALMAKADQLQGITAVAEPVMAAGGGMVAFAEGGLSMADLMRQATIQEQRDYQRTGVLSPRLQGMLKGETMPPKGSGKAGIEAILAEAEAGRGPNVHKSDGIRLTPLQAQLPSGKEFVIPAPPTPGVAPQNVAAPAAPTGPAMPPPPPAEEKKDMATLLAEREAQQKAFLGEDPSIKRLREALEKQGEESFLDRLMRGSQMVFAGEAQRTRGDIEPSKQVMANEAARKQAELKRQEALAEVESADYRRKADIYKEVAGEERKKAETASERAFQEKVLERKLQVEKELARMKPASASEYIGQLLRSKDRKDREVGKMLLGQSKTGALTRKDAAEMVLKANPTLAYSGKEQELEDAINRIMSTLGGSGGGFKVLGRE